MTTEQRILGDFASARSGDKGADANIGVWTTSPELFEILRRELTVDRVREHFAHVCRGDVVRYELPHLNALNFILHDALDGGGTISLRSDAQGKTLASGLLQMVVAVPAESVS